MIEQPTAPIHRNNVNIWHFAAGALPPLAATVVGLWQLLQPFMPHEHVGMLYIAMVACWIMPMAVIVWCKAESSRQEAAAHAEAAAERDAQLAEQIDRVGNALVENQQEIIALIAVVHRSIKGLHCRHDKLELTLSTIEHDVKHLRNLVLNGESLPVQAQRLGPRSLSLTLI